MKKLLTILLILFSATAFGQVTDVFAGHRTFQVGTSHATWNGTSSSDSTLSIYPGLIKLFKPLRLAPYATGSIPTGTPGVIGVNTDSNYKPFYTDGSGTVNYWGSGGGGGGGASFYSTDGTFTGNRTASLNGNTVTFAASARSRAFTLNQSDSFIHLINWGFKYEPDSLGTAAGNYFSYIKSSSLHSLAADYGMGRSFALQTSQAPVENTAIGDNLKANGNQINTSLSSLGIFQRYNLFTGSTYHHQYNLRYISAAGTKFDVVSTDITPGTNTIMHTISANNFYLINPAIASNATFPQYFIGAQNLITVQGSQPILLLKDTGFTSQTTSIKQQGPDLVITAGRNGTFSAGANTFTMTAGSLSLSSPFIGAHQGSPTAQLHIGAGSATAQTAPLKFTSGTLMTTPEAGAIEYNSGLWYGDSSSSKRDTLAMRGWVRNLLNSLPVVSFTAKNDIYFSSSDTSLRTGGALSEDTYTAGGGFSRYFGTAGSLIDSFAVWANTIAFNKAPLVAGLPVSSSAGWADLTSQTSNLTTQATLSADGTYTGSCWVLVNSISAGNFKVQVYFTDHTNTVRTIDLFPIGATSATISATGYYLFPDISFKAKSGTDVGFKVVPSGATFNYDFGGTTTRLHQ